MINYFESCSIAISYYLTKKNITKVWLPEDICTSLVSTLNNYNVKVDFFPIQRGWGKIDTIDLSMVPLDELIVISDLFNFRSIELCQFSNRNFALDLAHCSIDTALHYVRKMKHSQKKSCFICISMGKGKYYRFGGGGILIEEENYHELGSFNFPNIDYIDVPLQGVNFKSNLTSSRMVVSKNDISAVQVDKMRKSGIGISDGLYSHICKEYGNEYFIWKEVRS